MASVMDDPESVSTAHKVAKPDGLTLDTVGLKHGDRIEGARHRSFLFSHIYTTHFIALNSAQRLSGLLAVLWEVEMSDGTDESVWWGAVLADSSDEGTMLTYEAQHGFETETRRVLFTEGSFLWDAGLRESLPYRREGEEGPPLPQADEAADGEEVDEEDEESSHSPATAAAPEGSLPVGTAVKARYQNGNKYCAGVIHAAHADGTYDVLYTADSVLEEGVPVSGSHAQQLSRSSTQQLSRSGSRAAARSSSRAAARSSSRAAALAQQQQKPQQQHARRPEQQHAPERASRGLSSASVAAPTAPPEHQCGAPCTPRRKPCSCG